MPRPTPPAPPAVTPRDALTTRRVELELVTPLLGGSATPHENDAYHPVRGGSLRGPLRFWWRAARGGEFKDVAAMRRREEAIWGSAEVPSRVAIAVELLDKGEPSGVIEQFSDEHVPAYAAFSLPVKGAMRTVQWDIRFALTLSYPAELEMDVRAAVWAFATFGGVGGRTRRGFGAVQEVKVPFDLEETLARLKDDAWVKQARAPLGVPSLFGAAIVKADEVFEFPSYAWYHGIDALKAYRQNRRSGNTGKRPGRSYWCEPDALRRTLKRASAAHGIPVNEVDKYPRAIFGLPIVFHFKDANEPNENLKGAIHERLASPIVLRPARIRNGAISIALKLANSFHNEQDLVPDGLRIGSRRVAHALEQVDIAHLKQTGFKLPLQPDVLQSFLEFFKAF